MAITFNDNFDSGAADSTSSIDGDVITLVPPITWTGSPNNSWGWFAIRVDGVEGLPFTIEINNGAARAFGQAADRAWGWTTKDLPASPGDAPDTTEWVKCPFNYTIGTTTISMPTDFTDDTDSVFVALQPAYPVARLNRKFTEWQASEFVQQAEGADGWDVGSTTATTTLFSGRAIPSLPVRCFRVNQGHIPDAQRKTILITSGNHPGETMGRWAFEGFIEWLISEDPIAERLRRMCKIIVFPHVCPSGTHGGYFRTAPDQASNDHNRQWNQGETAPETVQLTMASIAATTGWDVDAHLDFHALMSGQALSELWYPASSPARDMRAFEGRVIQEYGAIAWTDFANEAAMIDVVRATSNRTVTLSALPDVLASDELESVEQIIELGEAIGVALSRTMAPPVGRSSDAILDDIIAILPESGRVWLASHGITVTGQGVSAWVEQTGETLTATQSTDADRPPLLELGSTVGHRPAMRFDRNGSAGPHLAMPNDIIRFLTNGASTAIVGGDFAGLSANEAWLNLRSTDTNANWRIYSRAFGGRIVPKFRQTATSNQNAIDCQPRYPSVFAARNSGTSAGVASSYSTWLDGVSVPITTEGATITNSFSGSVVGRLPTPSMWHTGHLWAIVTAEGMLEPEDIVALSELLLEYRDTADPAEWPADPADPGPPDDEESDGLPAWMLAEMGA